MRNITLLAAVSVLAIASPAAARDGSGYVGFDAGVLMADDMDFEFDESAEALDIEAEHKTGFDLDIIGGYDFGMIRAEGELSWKRTTHDGDYVFESTEEADADGETDVRSAMINALFDLGNDQWAFYAGGGVGYASVRNRIESGDSVFDGDRITFKDSGFAWQGIAGVRFAVNEIIDIGLKYRYFDTQNLEDEDDAEFDFTSHSLMFSFIYNMSGARRAPPPPPPMPPLPPAPPPPTQTCPDGSVILATDSCPPPPPPPPPPPEPERG